VQHVGRETTSMSHGRLGKGEQEFQKGKTKNTLSDLVGKSSCHNSGKLLLKKRLSCLKILPEETTEGCPPARKFHPAKRKGGIIEEKKTRREGASNFQFKAPWCTLEGDSTRRPRLAFCARHRTKTEHLGPPYNRVAASGEQRNEPRNDIANSRTHPLQTN